MRFARAPFGHYELIDFVAVLIGYMLSGEPTLLAFQAEVLAFLDDFIIPFDNKLYDCSSQRSG